MTNPFSLLTAAALGLIAFIPATHSQIFMDDFNRADSTSLGSDWVQTDDGGQSSIAGNEALLSVPAIDTESRVIPQVNIADFSTDIFAAGGFKVSFDWVPGTDYVTGVSGGYGIHIYFGPQNLAENVNAGFGNNGYGLRFQISGNGTVRMRDENGNVGSPIGVPSWVNQAPTSIELIVETDTFGTGGGTNSATLIVGGDTIFDDQPFGQWTEPDDLYMAIEGWSGQTVGSSTIDNLSITVIPEPNAGFLIGLIVGGSSLLRRRRS